MCRVRRSAFAFFRLKEREGLDVVALLRGDVRSVSGASLRSLSPVADVESELSPEDLEWLLQLSSEEWTEIGELKAKGVSPDAIESLIRSGVLISDTDDYADLRRREARMSRSGWPSVAALYHAVSQWGYGDPGSGDQSSAAGNAAEGRPGARIHMQELRDNMEADLRRFVEEHGPPPPITPREPQGSTSSPLPEPDVPESDLFAALSRRRTCRTFERKPVPIDALATILRWTFGCHGLIRVASDYQVQHKTSPSGGAMHPIEAYPIVLDVEGLEPGIYHYGSMTHRLTSIRALEETEARELAVRMAVGQDFVGEAGAVVALTARFDRNFWKYPGVDRSFGVVLQDLGHLSQTFYLLATHLGLGAAYTGAVASDLSAELVGKDPMQEGAVGLCVCGVPRENTDTWVEIVPFAPEVE